MGVGQGGRGFGLNRRQFVAGLLAGSVPSTWVQAAAAAATGPDGVPVYPDDYENWTGEFAFDDLLTCAPQSASDVVAAANWCARRGYALRPRGSMHNWSPLSTGQQPSERMLFADTRQHLTRMELTTLYGLPAVRVETGALVQDVMAFVESQGLGFVTSPAIGEITVGGALAINGHGAAVPAIGEARLPGQTFGSLSNRVLALTAVVWNTRKQRYVLQSFKRTDPEMEGLLVHLGRAFVTDVTLALEPNSQLRCVSHVDIPVSELFAAPGSGGRTIARFLDSAGRIEAIWYPFTERPWLKVWSVAKNQPRGSRRVTRPYNYPFSDNFPDAAMDLARKLITGDTAVTPLFGRTLYAVSAAGLLATASHDLWGASKNTLLFIKGTTLRVHESSYVVHTRRANAQQVIHDFPTRYRAQLERYAAEGRHPVNMPVEVRVSGLDHADDLGISGARTAALSALSPRPDRPEWDTGVWLSMLTIPGTPGMYGFFREMEQWVQRHFNGPDSCARPEWSKGWGYTEDAAWQDPSIIGTAFPHAFRAGRNGKANWDTALGHLDALDPKRLYRSSFLDTLTPRSESA
jgi:FAD/FMN-containing dehydrogenase